MIKLEFPANRLDIAAALGAALVRIGATAVPLTTTEDGRWVRGVNSEGYETLTPMPVKVVEVAPRIVNDTECARDKLVGNDLAYKTKAFKAKELGMGYSGFQPNPGVTQEERAELYETAGFEVSGGGGGSGFQDGQAGDLGPWHHQGENTVTAAGTYEVPESDPTPGASSEVDLHGVPFNETYCARAAVPFYASGSNSGQWKKRKGVEDDAYNKWYASQLDAVPGKLDAPAQPSPFAATNATSPFAAPAQAPAQHPSLFSPQRVHDEIQAANAPTNGSELMGWIAHAQGRGEITQAAINAAWAQTGLQVQHLFAPTPPTDVARNCAAVHHAVLSNV